ncbi:MAG: hypothetical protein IT381_03060 [Deltaproteobacteria bacterium]|nr:hypothetical protein [Deltaproteobacteria bacterium]
MRTSKVMAFSVPPEFERAILKHAEDEHRTVSEYLREAVRQYMLLRAFNETQKSVSKRLKKRGLGPKDVRAVVADSRR